MLSWTGAQESIKCFFCKKTASNHIYVHIYNFTNNFLQTLNSWILHSKLSLIDIVGVDSSQLTNYNSFFIYSDLPNANNRLIIYNFINYFINNRLLLIFFNNFLTKLHSLESIFLNANWLERELIEFFGATFYFKKDTRNLLLDYTFVGNPLLKSFPTEGYEELYFNFNNYSLSYISAEFVEL